MAERCPTTGRECLTLSLLVSVQDRLLDDSQISDDNVQTAGRERFIKNVGDLVSLAQVNCTESDCGVRDLGAVLSITKHANENGRIVT